MISAESSKISPGLLDKKGQTAPLMSIGKISAQGPLTWFFQRFLLRDRSWSSSVAFNTKTPSAEEDREVWSKALGKKQTNSKTNQTETTTTI